MVLNSIAIKADSKTIRQSLNWSPVTIITTGKQTQTITVPANKNWMFESVRLEYTSTGSTVAGNRQIALQILSSTNGILDEAIAGTVQAINEARNYHFYPKAVDLTSFRDSNYLSTPMSLRTLVAGQKIKLFDNGSASTADITVSRINILERVIPSTS